MNSMEHLWTGWRSAYVANTVKGNAGSKDPKTTDIFRQIADSGKPDEETFILHRSALSFAILNIYPYATGHLLVLPHRVVSDVSDLDSDEWTDLWSVVKNAIQSIKTAYEPEGINVGMNLGRPGGAGIPGHLHVHCLPRWVGDTNFMTTVANTRVLPEPLSETWEKLRVAWPDQESGKQKT